MDLLRRLMTLMNKPTEGQPLNEAIPSYYLGQTYAAQPNSDELRRAAYILTARTKKDIEQNVLPVLSCCFEGTNVVLRDSQKHKCLEFEVRKIVVSCVDAKNQRLLAIFYHNDSPYIAGPMTPRGLECHLFLCRNKEIARSGANRIGEMLSEQYSKPKRPNSNINIDVGQARLSKAIQVDEFDYENVSKFFRQKVFKQGQDYQDNSMYSTPCGSISTCLTSTGCDSGRASTIASFDIKYDEIIHSSYCDPISENEEDITSNNKNRIMYKNRYSVHYDLEDDDYDERNRKMTLTPDQTDVINSADKENGELNSSFYALEVADGELQRLLDLSETDI